MLQQNRRSGIIRAAEYKQTGVIRGDRDSLLPLLYTIHFNFDVDNALEI